MLKPVSVTWLPDGVSTSSHNDLYIAALSSVCAKYCVN
jgi:hypothetical protein